jgi:cyclopropane fatty-acyl-phospholipid synthase-like methyltransferase
VLELDVTENQWAKELNSKFDAVVAIDMLNNHSWDHCSGLMRHSSNVLKIGGKLIVYGPFIVKGIMPDNISLLNDKLKEQSLEYGIRDLENVI